jgi:hypothetical protein
VTEEDVEASRAAEARHKEEEEGLEHPTVEERKGLQ